MQNGEKLRVLEQGRTYVRVETEKGEQGWIANKAVATQNLADQFDELKKKYQATPTIASAAVRDDVYMHVSPGRDTQRFLLLTEGEKLKLIQRATLPKPLPPGQRPAPAAPVAPTDKKTDKRELPSSPRSLRLRRLFRWKTGGWCGTQRRQPAGC